ncbi:hypothetical protein [Desulfovibrio litoralis]|uniref:Uncharacterized protein n=1 Tax=Desulfovibrio litoralis DSM 11393 TaxID=1121455 RepID=A0A1M7RZF1_9BACT|nr:hypothetical protein [Desulfovibrio litoralis]SHN51571.1 hypothetical protein SAMN02745728_00362 [Desulfovibrio litoralis DSM 11393]
MSDEGRRVFKMEIVHDLLSGKSNAGVSEMLSFLSGRSLDKDAECFVTPLAKAWLFSLNTDLMKLCCCSGEAPSSACESKKGTLGDNISVEPIPAKYMESFVAILNQYEEAIETAETEQEATLELNKQLKALEPFKKKAEELEKKVAQLEAKVKTLTTENAELKDNVNQFKGKVAIDETGLESGIKDIVTKAVKASLGALAVAGAAGAVAGADAVAEPQAAEESANEVPDTFGFGASGSDNDGFGF